MKMRALCSQSENWRFFRSVRVGLLQNGHFKNVQNRFPKNKPRKVYFSIFLYLCFLYLCFYIFAVLIALAATRNNPAHNHTFLAGERERADA